MKSLSVLSGSFAISLIMMAALLPLNVMADNAVPIEVLPVDIHQDMAAVSTSHHEHGSPLVDQQDGQKTPALGEFEKLIANYSTDWNGAKPPVDDDAERLFVSKGPFTEGDKTVWEYQMVVTDSQLTLADGTDYKVWAFGGKIPGPTLVAREGDWIRITLINETTVPHTIHSHGLYSPQRMDGAPHPDMGGEHAEHNSNAPRPVEPGEVFTYEFIARPAGTHFYHCHVKTNEHMARGLSGAFIVLPKEPDPEVDQDLVYVLQEWDSSYAQQGKPGHPREILGANFFTINGRSFPDTQGIHTEVGDTIRLRFINAGTQEHYIHLHGHTFLVTHKDGAPMESPIEMDTMPIGPAERKDFILRTNNPGDWPMHCHSAPHITNDGEYPGGMMMHLTVGPEKYPQTGDGPIGPGLEAIRQEWGSGAKMFMY
ncbi:hypothetical protein GCM10007978_23850 [Shewanella hanedai]|uniref:Copper oxidase n=1 Tax=Shewanella hanedai TaxID=25 RepID=A0A553JNH0_SHEHA|nr:multicopper oxidase domain-containing protein [Shewanella hanedai]TRY14004.1 hypothetical protein FN961_12840 [Shewanella hanedai]GGI85393.1 hypothetical protein GCM10007978_23850 [Shewanella hanedai]